jgi:hypothetical protein
MFTRLISRKGTRKTCPPGTTYRSGFARKYATRVRREGYVVRRGSRRVRIYPKSRTTYIKSKCVKDPNARPGTRSISKYPLKKKELTRFGYHAHIPKTERRAALIKAAQVYGALPLYHKLDAVAKLSERRAPEAAAVFSRDRDWIRRTYLHGSA